MNDTQERHCCTEYKSVSRRSFLGGATAASVAATLGYAWLPRVAFGQEVQAGRDVIISIYLRGGADGCTLVVPHGDAGYYAARPSIAVPPPGSGQNGQATDLNGFFGLPQAMLSLLPAWQAGHLAIVHAVGSQNWSRSHFDAQKWMETSDRNNISSNSGWLGRHLATSGEMVPGSPLRAIGLTWGQPRTLNGGPKALPIPDPDNFGYWGWYPNQSELTSWIANQYNRVQDMTKQAVRDTRNTIATLDRINFEGYVPGGGADYPDSYFGRALRATACMIKANIGLEASHIDLEGWDTHADQGPIGGYMDGLMRELSDSIGAFHMDMSASNRMDFTLVVVSEFGRNILENGSRGTDHGAGNCMLVMGGKVNGGQVYGSWPGCAQNQLLDGYDLQMTTDYRAVLAEVVQKRLKNSNLATVFPEYTPTFLNVCQA
ncbi:MAG: DUF1501 domain-containing protein [Armatimonadetes bacterium]|nr:DUF1501 domain-containing protein [Armatimonadota bacterium]